MKSVQITSLLLVFGLANIVWARDCGGKNGCGGATPLFDSIPITTGNFAGRGGSLSTPFSSPADIATGTFSSQLNGLDGLTFDSRGARVQGRDGFLYVAGQPIFIGANGEVLVKDPVTGQFLPADANTTSQVLERYQRWAAKVANGQCPNDTRFAIAQRALNGGFLGSTGSGFQGGIHGGLGSPFQDGLNPLGNLSQLGGSPPASGLLTPIDPSIPSGSAPPSSQTPPAATPQSGTPPSTPGTGSHNLEATEGTSGPRPVEPVQPADQQFQNNVDKTNLRVFKDDKGNLFFLDKNGVGKRMFAGNGKIAFELSSFGEGGEQEKFSRSFADSRFGRSHIEVEKEKMQLTCGEYQKDFTEIQGEAAAQALKDVQFRPLPEIRVPHIIAQAESGEHIYVSKDKLNPLKPNFKLYIGKSPELGEMKITQPPTLDSSGSLAIMTEGGTFSFPSNQPWVAKPNQAGEEPFKLKKVEVENIDSNQLEKIIGKALLEKNTSQKLHTLCDQFENP